MPGVAQVEPLRQQPLEVEGLDDLLP